MSERSIWMHPYRWMWSALFSVYRTRIFLPYSKRKQANRLFLFDRLSNGYCRELILSGETKSYKVAEKVGYLDANYFSYVFKKRFGVSPSKYRASHLQKESES